jgi:hypothetical protein
VDYQAVAIEPRAIESKSIIFVNNLQLRGWLKRIENVDYFDKGTNFNPLKF